MPCVSRPALALAANGYSGAITNTRGWNEPVWTDPDTGTQYVGWVGDATGAGERRLMLAKRASAAAPWQRFGGGYTGQGFEDSHCAISICTLPGNIPIVAWGMHNDPLNLFIGRSSGDISGSSKVPLPLVVGETLTTQVTYPNFRRFSNGDLAFFFRNGVSGDGNLVMLFRTAAGVWSVRQNPLVDGQSARSFYPDKIIVDSADRIHIAGCWRESDSDLTTNHTLIYFYSTDKGLTWKQADGTSQTIPVTTSNDGVAWAIAQNTGLLNTQGMCVDDQGRPAIFRYYGASPSQYYCHYWDGTLGSSGSWARSQVGTEINGDSWIDDVAGASPRWLSQPNGLFRDGKWRMTFWSADRGDGLWCATSTDRASWSIASIDTGADYEGNEANFDPVQWSQNGVLDVFHQAPPFAGTPSAVSVRRLALP